MYPSILPGVFFFIFGTLIGSFVNVLIYRLPLDLSIVSPRSFCPNCKKQIYWYENIPILSYLFLRGRCSSCQAQIPWNYPFIELLFGVVSLMLSPKGVNPNYFLNYTFFFSVFCVFTAHFFIDLKHKILPNSLNIFLAVVFVLHSIILHPWQYWVLGSLIGIGLPLAVTWAFYLARGQIGLGGGDIKLYGALGLYLGPVGIIHNIFLSCLVGSVFGLFLIILKKMSKDNPIPFGPFIIFVASIQIFFPDIYQTLLSLIS